MGEAVSAAQKFALFCEEHGWEVEREIVNAKDEHKRVTAKSPQGAIVTAEWIKGAALGPAIGHYTAPEGGTAYPIKNQASARRIIDGSAVPKPREEKPRKERASESRPRAKRSENGEKVAPREIERRLDWDPYEITDDELMAILPGRSITWQTSLGYESGNVPPLEREVEVLDKKNNKRRMVMKKNPHVFISVSKSPETEGERIFNFCDPFIGFRAAYVAAIVEVG